MKITRSEDAANGRTLYGLEPQEDDGHPPVRQLWIDGRLLWSFPDHCCIAEALLVHNHASGPISFSAPCRPATADALRRLFAPRWVPVASLTLTPEPPPTGSRDVVLGRLRGAVPGFPVDLAPDSGFRTTLDMERAHFASNLRTLLRPGQSETVLALALTVLFAGMLDVRRIIIDRDDFPGYSDPALAALRAALNTVIIDLDIHSAHAPKYQV